LLVLTASGRSTLEKCRARFRAAVEALYDELDLDVDRAREVLREIDRAAAEVVAGR
jgi:hypothetical protein